MLHDVGKTTTPREILLAPRSLSDAEFAIMRDHAASGEAMVAEIERLRPFRPLVRRHHERLDGKGYPDRLAAADIPLSVRIVTVADCFNAMIGRRPYRLPLSPAAALDQLVKNRETQFDALVVEAMIDIVEHPDD
jgi:HD-GYP domain-containing protein (c-di-GMP phosphodiesterase class II)